MTVRGAVVLTKELAPGDGVSYGHTFVAEEPMRVGARPDGVRRRDPAARVLPRRGAARRHPRPGPRPDLHGPVRRRGRPRRTPATRCSCSARARAASRPPPTGRGGATRSTTRSSPAWVAGRPACGSTRKGTDGQATLPGVRRWRSRRGCSCRTGDRRGRRAAGGPRPQGGCRGGRPARRAALGADRGEVRRRRGPARRGRRGGAVRVRPRQAAPSRRPDAGLRARLRAQPGLLALPARGLPRQAPDGVLRPAQPRSLRALGPRARHDRPAR